MKRYYGWLFIIFVIKILADIFVQYASGLKADWHYFLPNTIGAAYGVAQGALATTFLVSENAKRRRKNLFVSICTARRRLPGGGTGDIFVTAFTSFGESRAAVEAEMMECVRLRRNPHLYDFQVEVGVVGSVDPRAFIAEAV